MKKSLFFAAMALLMSTPAAFGQVMGQGEGKIDVDAIKKSIAQSDADINDPKKNGKWATWLERGDIFMEAANAPAKGLFRGMEMSQVNKLYSKPTTLDTVRLRGENNQEIPFKVDDYGRVVTYSTDKKLSMWEEKLVIDSLALDKAAEAYDYAFSLDAKATERAYNGLNEIVKIVKDRGTTYQRLQEYEKAANEYRRSYIIQQYPLISVIDTVDVFFAGMNYTMAQNYKAAIECLKEAARLGYIVKDSEGNPSGDIYYYLYYSYTGLEEQDSARLMLLEGVKKYPNDSRLYRMLPIMYAVDVDADINEIVPIMEKAFTNKDNPELPRLYYGMAQAYAQRDMNDKAMEYFVKAADADHEDFSYQFNAAAMYLKKGDQMGREMQEQSENLPEDEFIKVRDEVYGIYKLAIPYLERAHNIEPDNESVISILADITFRLRETSDEMMEKSKKYEELNKAIREKIIGTENKTE